VKYTTSQNKAIHHEGENILVSASAGSGKTGVLKARVLRKIHDGINIDQLIVLTFTEAAAAEMKSRIIKELNQNHMYEQLIKMDNAIISTFDAFTLRLVKSYHYLLDLPSDISISDPLLIEMASQEVLDRVIESYYLANDDDFNQMVEMMFSGNDYFLSNGILRMAKAFKKIPNYGELINQYDDIYNQDRVKKAYHAYIKLIQEDVETIVYRFNIYYDENYHQYSDDCDDYLDACQAIFNHLLDEKDSESFINQIMAFHLPSRPRKPRGIDLWLETDKEDIDAIRTIQKELNDTHLLDMSFLDTWEETLPRVNTMLKMTKDYLNQMVALQKQKHLYSFDDIMNFAIQLFEEHQDIKRLYQSNINEILIDEYQDTNDLQDYFISLIANNNIFMVGDVKQSIYRFRDANPKNFMRLFNLYQTDDKGHAIRLIENFRSNRFLLNHINDLFLDIMHQKQGGVDYSDHHQLKTGYDDQYMLHHLHDTKKVHYYDLKAIQETDEDLKKEEIEAYIVANDIVRKINQRQPIFDGQQLRPLRYSDITILVDRKTSFNVYHKIFSQFSIPVDVYNKVAFSDSDEMIFINQFLKLLYMIQSNDTKGFKQTLFSVARSFVYQIKDPDIIHFLVSEDTSIQSFLKNPVFEALVNDIEALLPWVDVLPNVDVIDHIYLQTHIYEKLIHLDVPASAAQKLDHFRKLISSQKERNFKDLIDYLNFIQEQKDVDIEYKETKDDLEAVKLMSIHASKGLQFPIVYLMGLYKRFNFTDDKEPFNFSNDLGILTYGYQDGFYRTFLEKLYFRQHIKEDVSEKIRLMYVALTRAKEEINLVLEAKEEPMKRPIRFSNYQEMLYVGYKLEPYDVISQIKKPKIQKQDVKAASAKSISYHQFNFIEEDVSEERFSKKEHTFYEDDVKKALSYGDEVHQMLEDVDYRKMDQDLTFLPVHIQDAVLYLKKTPLFQSLKQPEFFQEYEFVDASDGYDRHGIIDLLIIDEEKVIILDYKLKHIDEPAYEKQLLGYRAYLEKRINKPIEGYLYALIDRTLKKVF
jgi:ATP-dependent helicase/nuclease subunit A